MKNVTEDFKTVTFETGNENFLVDVVVRKGFYEVWLYRESIGIKELIICVHPKCLEDLINQIENYLDEYEMYDFYDERYW